MNLFDSTKTIIENLYYLSGPILCIITVIALKQLSIAKESIRINSQRQSATMAYEICEKFLPDFVKSYNTVTDKMSSLGIDYLKIEELNLDKLEVIEKGHTNYSEYQKVLDHYKELEFELWNLASLVERFATPFIRKLADEELAYTHGYYHFNQICNLCCAYIIKARETDPSEKNLFENVIQLYSIWQQRYEKEKVDAKIEKLFRQRNSFNVKTIKPIGTE